MSALFAYKPNEMETEKASNGYLMSMIGVMVGMPLPILNLLALLIFFFSNRKCSYFIRWHNMQTLISQCSLLLCNSVLFVWTIEILFYDKLANNTYFGYLFTVLLFHIVEFSMTISAAVRTRKGMHVQWWFSGALTQLLCRPDVAPPPLFPYQNPTHE